MEPAKKKMKWYNMIFNDDWLKDPKFKDWLERDKKSKDSSYCKCCAFALKNANRSALLKHANSAKHKTNFESAKSKVNIMQFINNKKKLESEQVAKSELPIAGFFLSIIYRFLMRTIL